MDIGNPKDSLGMPAIGMILISFSTHTMALIDRESHGMAHLIDFLINILIDC